MNALRNKVQLIGNLGNDPQIIQLDNGKKLAKFSLATNESYRNGEGQVVKDTQWHTMIAWGKIAIIIEKYLAKGNEIAVEGKLTNRSWDDSDGKRHYTTEVIINELLMLGK